MQPLVADSGQESWSSFPLSQSSIQSLRSLGVTISLLYPPPPPAPARLLVTQPTHHHLIILRTKGCFPPPRNRRRDGLSPARRTGRLSTRERATTRLLIVTESGEGRRGAVLQDEGNEGTGVALCSAHRMDASGFGRNSSPTKV
jgi:hypothetical protein